MSVRLCRETDNENATYNQYKKCNKYFVLSIDVQYSYYIHVCTLFSCLELHPSYRATHAHGVGAHAYYSNSGVTRAVRDCYSGTRVTRIARNAHKITL